MIFAEKALYDRALNAYHNLAALFDRVKLDFRTKLSLFDTLRFRGIRSLYMPKCFI